MESAELNPNRMRATPQANTPSEKILFIVIVVSDGIGKRIPVLVSILTDNSDDSDGALPVLQHRTANSHHPVDIARVRPHRSAPPIPL